MKIKKTYTIYSRTGLWVTAILCAVILGLSACSKGMNDPHNPNLDDDPISLGGGMPDPNSVRLTVDPPESVNEELLLNTKQMK